MPEEPEEQISVLPDQESVSHGSGEQLAPSNVSPSSPRPVPPDQKQELTVMEREVVEIGQTLRSITWPKRWPERFASALLGISVAAFVAALATTRHHSAISGIRNGYWWLAAVTFALALIFYRSMSEEQENPMATVRRVVKKMEELQWISGVPDPEVNRRERLVRDISHLLRRLLLIDRRTQVEE